MSVMDHGSVRQSLGGGYSPSPESLQSEVVGLLWCLVSSVSTILHTTYYDVRYLFMYLRYSMMYSIILFHLKIDQKFG